MPSGQRKMRVNTRLGVDPRRAASSSRTSARSSPSCRPAYCSNPARPTKLRTSTSPSGARPLNLVELQVVAMMPRSSARGITKPKPRNGCATSARRNASETVAESRRGSTRGRRPRAARRRAGARRRERRRRQHDGLHDLRRCRRRASGGRRRSRRHPPPAPPPSRSTATAGRRRSAGSAATTASARSARPVRNERK